jgi:hypothetical protein
MYSKVSLTNINVLKFENPKRDTLDNDPSLFVAQISPSSLKGSLFMLSLPTSLHALKFFNILLQ